MAIILVILLALGASSETDLVTKYVTSTMDSVSNDVQSTLSIRDNVVPTSGPVLGGQSSTLDQLQGDRTILLTLERQMLNLRSELSQVMKNRAQQIDVDVEVNQIRMETENLRSELRKTRNELRQLKETREQDQEILAKVKINEATNKWMKNMVAEFRNELKEMSNAEENITETMQHRQQTQTEISLLKSDFKSLLSSHQELKAAHERDLARIDELGRDTANIRSDNQKLAKQYQVMSLQTIQIQDDVSILQSNHRAALQQLKKIEVQITEEELFKITNHDEKNDTPTAHHRQRHHGNHDHLRRELTALSESVNQVIYRQDKMERSMKGVQENISQIMTASDDQLNKLNDISSAHHLNVSTLSAKVHKMDLLLQSVESSTLKHSTGLHNLSEFTASVYNLHDSTMQLFTSLEGIDTEMTASIQELQKEVSKLSYNVVQSHASLDVIKQDQISHFQELQEVRKDLSSSKLQMEKDHITLTSVHNDLLQINLKKCKDENADLLQDARIANAESRLAQIETKTVVSKRELDVIQMQLKRKVSQSSAEMWKKAYKDLNVKLQKTTTELQTLDHMYEKLDKEMSHFVYQLPHDCSMNVKNPSASYSSGVYLIRPVSVPEAVEVYCDLNDSDEYNDNRWTVIQRRFDGSENFFRDWQEYKEGFGNRNSEYWIGNDIIHRLTDQANCTLRIELWDKSGNYSYADYENFYVGDETDKYRLYIDGYSGNASDAMAYHNKQAFSTKDSDNDASSTHCAVYYSAGWWYTHCQYVNANGLYNTGLTWYNVQTHEWSQLEKIVLKIKHKRLT